eukprot:15463563-Alexandrium_andersonii.AAC.1
MAWDCDVVGRGETLLLGSRAPVIKDCADWGFRVRDFAASDPSVPLLVSKFGVCAICVAEFTPRELRGPILR